MCQNVRTCHPHISHRVLWVKEGSITRDGTWQIGCLMLHPRLVIAAALQGLYCSLLASHPLKIVGDVGEGKCAQCQ
jgi:hypothetical protein